MSDIVSLRFNGFESLVDLEQDIMEAIRDLDIPSEFNGVITIKISYDGDDIDE